MLGRWGLTATAVGNQCQGWGGGMGLSLYEGAHEYNILYYILHKRNCAVILKIIWYITKLYIPSIISTVTSYRLAQLDLSHDENYMS